MASSSSRSLPLGIALLVICCLSASSWAATSARASQDDGGLPMMDRFRLWMETHGKSYPTAGEELRRFEVYRRNVEHIDATNRAGRLSYTLGENQFTDLTSEEFLATYTGRYTEMAAEEEVVVDDGETVITTRAGDVTEGRRNLSAVPDRIDWRALGAVTPVKNQGTCGSCYAFAAVAAVEGLHQIKTGELVSLSEQQILDCGVFGCTIGTANAPLTWIRKNGGITTEADYPYTGKKGTCDKSKLAHHAATVRDYGVMRNNEQKLLETVAKQPVTVVIEASAAWQSYQSGVFSGPCGFTNNHIVTVVGYGKDAATGKKYWIVKNSYGQSWGMGGYILMERGIADPRGLCNINYWPVYPTM